VTQDRELQRKRAEPVEKRVVEEIVEKTELSRASEH
jgi:hypothetical protein